MRSPGRAPLFENDAPAVVVTDLDTSVKALPTNALERAIVEQTPRLARCSAHADGAPGGVLVNIDWRMVDGGVEDVRPAGKASALTDCVVSYVARFQFPPGRTRRQGWSWLFTRDGGVEPRAFAGAGGLDKDAIKSVIRAHQQEVTHCYQLAQAKNSRLGGKLMIAWTIGPDGSVVKTRTQEDSLSDSEVAACVIARVKSRVFPSPSQVARSTSRSRGSSAPASESGCVTRAVGLVA